MKKKFFLCHFLPGICETTPILHFLLHNFEIQLLQNWIFQFFWFQLSSSTWNNSKPWNFLYIHMIGKNFYFYLNYSKKIFFFHFDFFHFFFSSTAAFKNPEKLFRHDFFFFFFSQNFLQRVKLMSWKSWDVIGHDRSTILNHGSSVILKIHKNVKN